MELGSNVWFTSKTKGYFGKGRIELLEQIHKTGSISKAAKVMKMSYKAAWDAVNEMNNLSEAPIVKRETGGKGGGGTELTAKGLEYIEIYKQVESAQSLFFDALGHYAGDLDKLIDFTSKLTLRTSARNQLLGIVTEVNQHKTSAEVTIRIYNGVEVVVLITKKSLEDLEIRAGSQTYILLKSSWISLHKSPNDFKSNLNYLPGSVTAIDEGDIKSEITITTAEENTLIASVTNEEKSRLDIQIGDQVWAAFEISSALLAV